MQDDLGNRKADAIQSWTDDLVCPVCFARLIFSETTVTCAGCARTYPIVDGIPVLLPERGLPRQE